MRILFWEELFWPYIGGVEILAGRMVPALRARGHELVVVTRRDVAELPPEDEHDGVPVRRFPFWAPLASGHVDGVVALRRQVAELKRSFEPDLVHINSFGPSAVFHLDTEHVRPVPLVVTLHGAGKLVGGPGSLLEQTLGRADWVVGCSAAVLEQGRRLVPAIAARSSVIHNAAEPPALSPSPLPFAPPHLVCLGRLVADKGFDLALAAFPAILARRPDARLTIGGDGPARAELVRQAARLRLGPVVNLPGWVRPADVPALLNTATVVLLPSRQDSLPLVALEAAVMARPVVATAVGGLPEVVVHRRTGLLVPPEDPAALATALVRLLDRPALATRLGAAARARVHRHFSWPRYLDAYDALYRRLAFRGRIG